MKSVDHQASAAINIAQIDYDSLSKELQLFGDDSSSTEGQHGSSNNPANAISSDHINWSPSALQPQSEAVIAATSSEIEEILQSMSDQDPFLLQGNGYSEDRQRFF